MSDISERHVINYVHTALFVIARNWIQPRCPSTEEWIMDIDTMEYYLTIKSQDMMDFAGKWKEFENIFLSEVAQFQNDMKGMYSLINRY